MSVANQAMLNQQAQLPAATLNLDGLMSELEFCKKIGICRASLFKLRKAKLISYVTKGRRVFYDGQSYQDYLRNCCGRVDADPASNSPAAPRRSSRFSRRRIRSPRKN